MLFVRELVISQDREEHIALHHVLLEEVEEACSEDSFVSKTREGRLRVIGQTENGRYLTIILAPEGRGVFALITARDATESERRLYHRKGK